MSEFPAVKMDVLYFIKIHTRIVYMDLVFNSDILKGL